VSTAGGANMGFVTFFAVGLITGWLSNLITEDRKLNLIDNMGIGIFGAMLGDLVAGVFAGPAPGPTSNLIFIAIGSASLILVARLLSHLSSDHELYF
jgi:uncharacterized membrane protein YeaQ/YmgE (transglycosylase-associated protein family)